MSEQDECVGCQTLRMFLDHVVAERDELKRELEVADDDCECHQYNYQPCESCHEVVVTKPEEQTHG